MPNQVLAMPKEKYYVYMVTDSTRLAIYTGVTNDLKERILKYKKGAGEGFADKRGASKLVYFEIFDEPYSAISREKVIKSASNEEKTAMVEANNRAWCDLFREL